MASRGTVAKEAITKKIFETFPSAFKYNKELRIPFMEDGNLVQIKVTLTAAKDNVVSEENAETMIDPTPVSLPADFINEPTAEEKEAVESLCRRLNII